jgi:hypothetical protein
MVSCVCFSRRDKDSVADCCVEVSRYVSSSCRSKSQRAVCLSTSRSQDTPKVLEQQRKSRELQEG